MTKRTSWFSKRPSVAFALSMLVVSILPLLCGWIFYAQSSAVAREQQENIVERSLQLTMQQFDTDLQNVINMSLALKQDLNTLALPDEEALTLDNRMAFFEKRSVITSHLRSSASNMIKDAYLLRPDADYAISPAAVISRQILYTRYWEPFGISEKAFSMLHLQYETGALLNPDQARPIFLLSISRDYKTGLPTRQLVLVLVENYFPTLFSGYNLPDVTYALYRGDTLIYQSSAAAQEDVTTFTLPSSMGNYTLVATVPDAYFYNHAAMQRVLYLSMLIGTLLISALLIFSLARRNAMPINQIIAYIRENYPAQDNKKNVEGLNLIQTSVEHMLHEHDIHQQQLNAYQEREEMHILGNALLGLNQALPPTPDDATPFAVALFPLKDHDPEQMKNAIAAACRSDYIARCVFLSGDLFVLLRKADGQMDEDQVALLLESILQSLDDSGAQNLYCAMSGVHTTPEELNTAYREAVMAGDALAYQKDMPVMRFDTVRYSPEYFLRDYHHLDKQLAFAAQIHDQDFEAAQTTLASLFPDEFSTDNTSVFSQLHLSSLKFQFLHDLNSLSSTPSDADELNRINVRNILSCQTHGELRGLMHKIISELDAMPTRQGEEHDMQIDEIKTYIRNNSWDKQLSVSSVADAFHLSSNALSKLFSRKANMGVLQYIHKIRIENACSLLLSDESSSIASIAMQVGYASTLTFNRAFKARYNMTPSEYRRIHKTAT